MAFDIREFKARGLPMGGARPSQFRITVKSPFSSATEERISFTARAASLPPAVVDAVEVPYFGRRIKYAGDRTFPDWSFEIMNDEDFAVRSLFERWSNEINAIVDNVRRPGAIGEQYKQDALVEQFSKAGSVIRSYKMVGLWPNTVDVIRLDWDAVNQIETFAVNCSYDYWIPVVQGTTDTYDTGESA